MRAGGCVSTRFPDQDGLDRASRKLPQLASDAERIQMPIRASRECIEAPSGAPRCSVAAAARC